MRGYLTGSAWRDIESKDFEKKYGFAITSSMVEGGKLVRNCKLKEPIVTPTTKARTGHDEPLTPEQARGLVGEAWEVLVEKALKLYERGAQFAEERGLILVDTKYEFGKLNGEVLLVDEVHTPDSSRYWYAEEYVPGGEMVELSKQFVRDLVQKAPFTAGKAHPGDELTERDVGETRRRYVELYERLTGNQWQSPPQEIPIAQRIVNNLIDRGYIQGGYVQILSASEGDERAQQLKKELKALKIPYGACGEASELIERLNKSIEPVVMVVMEESLLEAACQARFSVIACLPSVPPSLMESAEPWLLCRSPVQAGQAAERILASANPLFAERR